MRWIGDGDGSADGLGIGTVSLLVVGAGDDSVDS